MKINEFKLNFNQEKETPPPKKKPKINDLIKLDPPNSTVKITQHSFKEDSFEECQAVDDKKDSDSPKIVDTIKLISKNPEKFKHTNRLLKTIGELSKNNMHILYNDTQEKEKAEKAYKEFEEAAVERKKLKEYSMNMDQIIKSNKQELTNIRGITNKII
jgi:hypothetical protein